MRIPILFKLLTIISLITVSVLVAVLFSTNDIFYQDKRAFVVELSSKLSAGLSKIVETQLNAKQKEMAVFVTNYESLTAQQKRDKNLNFVLFTQYPDYLAVGLFDMSSKKAKWLLKNPEQTVEKWQDLQFLQKATSFIDFSNVPVGQLVLKRLDGPKRQSIFAALLRVELQASNARNAELKPYVLMAYFNDHVFADVVEEYKGALNTVFVIDENGVVYAHPNNQYVGKSLAQHSVVMEMISSKRIAGAGADYVDLNGEEVAASYQGVLGSNLSVVSTTPKSEAFRAADDLFRNILVIGLGVGIIAVILSLFFTKLITSPLNRLKKVAAQIGSGDFSVDVNVSSSDEIGDLANSISNMAKSLIERDEQLDAQKNALVQSEKMSAFGQLSAGIAHEVKNPLAGILGHAQLAKGKTPSPDMLKHIEFIEKETRRTKDIIENLMKFARAEKLELEPTNLFDTVHGAVGLVDHQLSLQNVKIHKHISRVGAVLGQSNQIQQVLLNLMMNAGHAMEGQDEKRLDVYLEEVDGKAQIRVQDNGSGMPEDVKNRIFEPFFTTKPAGKGTGLGLAVSVGIVKDHKADIRVESEIDVGTTFILDFPLAEGVELPSSEIEQEESAPIEPSIGGAALQAQEQEKDNPEETPVTSKVEEKTSLIGREASVEATAIVPAPPEEEPIAVAPEVLASEIAVDPEASDAIAEEKMAVGAESIVMPASRDYLMKEGEKKQYTRPVAENSQAERMASHADSDFKVKIRRPKTK